MRYELELIKKRAVVAMNNTQDKVTIGCLEDIIKLSEACLEAMDSIDTNITNLTRNTRRVTTKYFRYVNPL